MNKSTPPKPAEHNPECGGTHGICHTPKPADKQDDKPKDHEFISSGDAPFNVLICGVCGEQVSKHEPSPQASETETMESVFAGLPNGCTLKNPNNYNKLYQCVYLEHTKAAVRAYGDTPSEAVVRLAELLASTKTPSKEKP